MIRGGGDTGHTALALTSMRVLAMHSEVGPQPARAQHKSPQPHLRSLPPCMLMPADTPQAHPYKA